MYFLEKVLEVYVDMPNGKRKACPAATDSMSTLLDMIDNMSICDIELHCVAL
jgi:hypothetical protein